MSIVFFGTPEFAVPSLKTLLAEGEEVCLVVTQPDRVSGRGHRLSHPPVKGAALEAGLNIIQPESLRGKGIADEISSLSPEFIVVVAYGKVLPPSVLTIPLKGCINVHASLLPRYRGAAPIQWSIINGDEMTGVTTMLMDEGLDTGSILLQQETVIKDDDTSETLGKRLSTTGASLLIKTIKGIRDGSVRPQPQAGESSYAPIIKKKDGMIDWSKSAMDIFNFVRGMQPWPGAYCYINSELVKLIKTEHTEGRGMPGVIAKTGSEGMIIGTGKDLLSVIELQPSGKKPMPAAAFIQGRRITAGRPL
ncbi:MAG: methionyl-tRNA formyltransferase [Nitrospirota bacterium]